MLRRWLEPVRAAAAEQWPRALALALVACALLPLLGRAAAPAPARGAAAAEWPSVWDGAPLRPLALSAVERRFAEQFPGRIARFESADALWVLRDVTRPTRALHPATDCFRGLGYRVDDARLELDERARLWRCFVAVRDGAPLRVCERIVDADEQAFTDTSAWYWAAMLGRSVGPWRAITRVQAL
jgi:hypothetical protein